MNKNSIPTDIVFEIFWRLPSNSIARCRCVSRLWRSMLRRPYFTELFLKKSLSCPRLLFALQARQGVRRAADFHMKLPGDMYPNIWGYTSGLMWHSKDGRAHVICNPSTGQCASLPKLRIIPTNSRSFLGFDPIDKQFKVLLLAPYYYPCIVTLGTGEMKWRTIGCSLPYYPFSEGICINGVLYYLGSHRITQSSVLVWFDVKSEKFKFIDVQSFCKRHTTLINYKGKLGGVDLDYVHVDGVSHNLELCMWVLEDVEKKEFSKHAYTLIDSKLAYLDVSIVGGTPTGEIVLSTSYHARGAFCVFYFNPESDTLHSVEFRCKQEALAFCSNRVYVFLDHVEDLKFNVIKTTSAATSSEARMQKDRGTFESINKFDALCLNDDE
ncbi:unnamed protein product [Microthlaspi erraticum]|uniref:F-box domain-containing protein n=1 Tax=Microthlaspi erraticum TaxID=1685480 RepID=A0A6D2L3T9_9BRAS|nr:unnamed protein product [Microthlaspi erraticum]